MKWWKNTDRNSTDIEHAQNNKIMKPVNKYKLPQNRRFGMTMG
jgi:hypothetical protein